MEILLVESQAARLPRQSRAKWAPMGNAAGRRLALNTRDPLQLKRIMALFFILCLSMIHSENRSPLSGIML
jgi:hypothetical protein